jgi:hypothetical protein
MKAARNEMPMPFHFLSACVVIGQMLGLESWATLAQGVRVYPNVNALLLSPAGKCRRGEGTKLTAKIARQAGVHLLEGKTTPEGLLDELEESSDTLLYVEELSMLLTKQDFQRPIIAVITKLLLHGEGAVDLRTRGVGRRSVPRVNLSALFTSAPDWFMQTIPEEAFGGGMMSRFLVCCLDERETFHIDIQADDEHSGSALTSLANRLKPIKDLHKGRMTGTNEAQKWIVKWYMENETELVEDDRLGPHRNRKPANLLRLAMILAVSSGETKLTKPVLERTLAILDWLEPTLVKLYGMTEEIASVTAKGETRVLSKIMANANQRISHAALARSCMSYFRGGAREFRNCLLGLQEKGLITAEGTATRWPPQYWAYTGTEHD